MVLGSTATAINGGNPNDPSGTALSGDTSTASSSSSSPALAVGIATGLGLLALCVVLLVFRRRRRQREKTELNDEWPAPETTEKTSLSSVLKIGRGPSSTNIARISAASSFASPFAPIRPITQLFDEDPFCDNSSHGHGTENNPFTDQNPFMERHEYDPNFDAPTDVSVFA